MDFDKILLKCEVAPALATLTEAALLLRRKLVPSEERPASAPLEAEAGGSLLAPIGRATTPMPELQPQRSERTAEVSFAIH